MTTDKMSANPPGVLDARDLVISYRHSDQSRRVVLGDFSLQLAAGELVAVLGPSGAGKSSLLRVLAGLQRPDSGTVRVHGRPLDGPHPRVSFVFQDPSLLPWLTLEENVGFGLGFRHQPRTSDTERRQRVRSAIAEVDLVEARQRYPAALSGGMAQRAALARSLTRQPEILMLDEPFSALDRVTRGEMQELLEQIILRHGSAAILVTHDVDEALRLADRVLLIGRFPARVMAQWRLPRATFEPLAPAGASEIRAEIMQVMHDARHLIPGSRRAPVREIT